MTILKKIIILFFMIVIFFSFSFSNDYENNKFNDENEKGFDKNKISSFFIGVFLAFGFFIYLFYNVSWENIKGKKENNKKQKEEIKKRNIEKIKKK